MNTSPISLFQVAKDGGIQVWRISVRDWNIHLVCWCVPLACHGDVIKQATAEIKYINDPHPEFKKK